MQPDTQSYDDSVATTAHTDINGVIRGLEASLNDLGGFVAAVKSSWSGDEMEQYNAMQGTWNKSADTVREILTAVHGGLGKKTSSVKEMRAAVTGILATQT